MSAKFTEVTLEVTAHDYGDERPMFMREPRTEGELPDGTPIEVSVNALGYGIIVKVGDRTFSVNERALMDAVLDRMEEDDETNGAEN